MADLVANRRGLKAFSGKMREAKTFFEKKGKYHFPTKKGAVTFSDEFSPNLVRAGRRNPNV